MGFKNVGSAKNKWNALKKKHGIKLDAFMGAGGVNYQDLMSLPVTNALKDAQLEAKGLAQGVTGQDQGQGGQRLREREGHPGDGIRVRGEGDQEGKGRGGLNLRLSITP